MNKFVMKVIPNVVIGKVSRTILKSKKNSPHIFFVAGVAGAVTSVVLACRATLKLSATLDEIKTDMELLIAGTPPVTQMEDDSQVVAITTYAYGYSLGGYKLLKLYAPAIIIGAASIAALTGSHVQMTRRNAALMAAYAAIQQAFEEYRSRVQDKFGKEQELDIYHNVSTEVVKNEAGEKQEIKIINGVKYSEYAKFFDEYSPNWQRNSELNRIFVQCQQDYANDLLRARGHVFLNEVYDLLGIDRSSAGAVVGWVLHGDGDNYVDFGLFQAYNSGFVNGWEHSILLDFNVDGIVYDKI